MKPITKLLLSILGFIMLTGCLKDKVSRTYTILTPVYKEKQEVLATVKPGPARALENPGKIYAYGAYLFINDVNKGVHIVDNSNPRTPVNKAFISIPGNVDIAVKGTILYADIYSDMIAMDISDPLQATITKVTSDIFPERNYISGSGYFIPDPKKYIVDWEKKDTTVAYEEQLCNNCGLVFDNSPISFANAASSTATVGIAGSMARFAIVNSYMYAVGLYQMKVLGLETPASPDFIRNVPLGSGIETIFPFGDKLFIGSNTATYIMDISDPTTPRYLSVFPHVRSCDPVVTDGIHAFVTLRAGNFCGNISESKLDILDVRSLTSPKLIASYPLKNPYGLGKDGNLLWICDGSDGLKLYDVTDPSSVKLKETIKTIEPFDVIPMNGRLIVSAKEGILQYDYSNPDNITLLSRIQKK